MMTMAAAILGQSEKRKSAVLRCCATVKMWDRSVEWSKGVTVSLF